MTAEKKEAFPLHWPDDWPRTRPQDQSDMRSWKKTANQYRDALVTELTRMESPSAIISCNIPLNLRHQMICKARKAFTEFHRTRTSPDGHYSQCKDCRKPYTAKYYRANKAAIYERSEQWWAAKSADERARIQTARSKRYRHRNPDVERAHRLLKRAIRLGQITPPACCSRCGLETTVQGHHFDYSKPLEVIWLCYHCHKAEHQRIRRGEQVAPVRAEAPPIKPYIPTVFNPEAVKVIRFMASRVSLARIGRAYGVGRRKLLPLVGGIDLWFWRNRSSDAVIRL